MPRKLALLLILSIIMIVPATLSAGPLVEFTTPGNAFTNGSWTFGIDFSVGRSDILVTSLGYYDDSGNGFTDNHELGLYDSLGTLLASTTATSGSTLIGHFRYQDIAPVTLLAGQTYRVVGVSHSDLYTWGDPGFAADPSVTYLGDTYDPGTTLFDPVGQFHNDVSDGFFGPNLFINGTSSGVPEPGAYSLVGCGLAALLVKLRRRAA
jgi:hypothetical protein